MIRHIQIDDSNSKAKALLDFLKTLEFVKVDSESSDEFVLTERHIEILEERRANHLSGKSKSHSWEEVQAALGKQRITK